ncbi:hypothetical protein BDZ89DRAFT_1259258 [Hymenopellis radicata]|nr:hypothetical protein BDZ89DRAFT_1259258 [Hymenopellis radicata]
MLRITGKLGRFLTKQLERLDPDSGHWTDHELGIYDQIGTFLTLFFQSMMLLAMSLVILTLPPSATQEAADIPCSSRSSYGSRKADHLEEATEKSSTARSRPASPIFERAKDGTYIQIQCIVKSGTRVLKRVLSDDESDTRKSDSEHRRVKKRRRGAVSSSRVGRSLKRALSSS